MTGAIHREPMRPTTLNVRIKRQDGVAAVNPERKHELEYEVVNDEMMMGRWKVKKEEIEVIEID